MEKNNRWRGGSELAVYWYDQFEEGTQARVLADEAVDANG
jgi:hypothetical protein